MLQRLLLRLVRSLPEPLLLRVGRWYWSHHRLRRVLQPLTSLMRSGEAVIARGPAAGLRIDASDRNFAYTLGVLELPVQEALVASLRPGHVCFDVGANVGFLTLLCARLVGPGGRVVAFEPLPAAAAALRANLARNGFANVEVREEAAGERSGSAWLAVGADTALSRMVARQGPGTIAVPVVAIDDLVRSGAVPAPQVVKIDVEGAEVEVIRGMRDVLRRYGPVVLCEMHDRNREYAAALAEAGYTAVTLGDGRPVAEAHWGAQTIAHPGDRTGSPPVAP